MINFKVKLSSCLRRRLTGGWRHDFRISPNSLLFTCLIIKIVVCVFRVCILEYEETKHLN